MLEVEKLGALLSGGTISFLCRVSKAHHDWNCLGCGLAPRIKHKYPTVLSFNSISLSHASSSIIDLDVGFSHSGTNSSNE
jgi:hypothetical protein